MYQACAARVVLALLGTTAGFQAPIWKIAPDPGSISVFKLRSENCFDLRLKTFRAIFSAHPLRKARIWKFARGFLLREQGVGSVSCG